MKNFKKFISMLLVLVMTVALAACGGSEPAGEEAGTSDVKAACVLGIGGLGDQGYNDLIYAGMERAKAELGIEFDYASVHCVRSLKKLGYEVVIVNNNPETVSTDFDTADRLYFEPLTDEDVMSIIQTEKPYGAVVAFGGQTAIKLTSFLR